MSEQREPGLYWIKGSLMEGWRIAEWKHDGDVVAQWFDYGRFAAPFMPVEIDERRILPPSNPAVDEARAIIQDCWGALNFILAFYEPGQRYLDTNAWKQAEASGRRAHAASRAWLDAVPPTGPSERRARSMMNTDPTTQSTSASPVSPDTAVMARKIVDMVLYRHDRQADEGIRRLWAAKGALFVTAALTAATMREREAILEVVFTIRDKHGRSKEWCNVCNAIQDAIRARSGQK